MPGSVQNAAPTTVLPLSLSRAFAHSREYPVAVNEFVDGGAQRGLLAKSSRKRWRLAKRLRPAKMAELRPFYEARKGPHEVFYFYDPYETNPRFSYDPTGTAVQGRYTVRFQGGWRQAMNLGRGDVEIQLVEAAQPTFRTNPMELTGHFTLEEFVRNSVILERGRNPQSETDDCIHIQFRVYYPRRTAFVGQTHNRGVYRPVEVAA